MKLLYFGHSRILYDTKEEEKAIEIIRKKYSNYGILNPNKNKHQINCTKDHEGVPGSEMQYFLNLTKMCKFGIFLIYDENKWSPGSYTEAKYMLDKGKEVYIIDMNNWKFKQIKEIKNHYTFNEEKEKLIKLGKYDLAGENG